LTSYLELKIWLQLETFQNCCNEITETTSLRKLAKCIIEIKSISLLIVASQIIRDTSTNQETIFLDPFSGNQTC